MRYTKILFKLFIIYSVVLLILPFTNVQAEEEFATIGNDKTVYVGIYVISIGNFEFSKGTYLVDFYLVFRWSNQNISPSNFEFMNGRAVSKEKIYESINEDYNEIWYRIQASLFTTPEFKDYPFDTQSLKIILEDSQNNISTLSYSPLEEVIDVSKDFSLSGWKIESFDLSVDKYDYKWGEEYSRAIFTIKLVREAGPNVVKILLPPIIFCLVSG